MINTIVEFIFGAALFINALLFIPQSIRIFREKTAQSVSLTTFVGLLLIQFAIVLHGIIVHDSLLIWGYVLPFIFDKYVRDDTGDSQKYPGTGLGLYFVKKYVEDLGGTLRVDSELSKGSVFSINVPKSMCI